VVRQTEVIAPTAGGEPLSLQDGAHTLRHHLTHTAEGKPGNNFRYNGFLFARLSAVVDAVSEKPFNRSVREDILEPLGMADTALGTSDPANPGILSRVARPYRLDQDRRLAEPDSVSPPFDSVNASVGIISSVNTTSASIAMLSTARKPNARSGQRAYPRRGKPFPMGSAGLCSSMAEPGCLGTTAITPMRTPHCCSRSRTGN
jgi:CubicO group peptidase (beta-lactamase class C family)